MKLTASQTVGPFFGVGLTHPSAPASLKNVLAGNGQRIRIEGTVYDGDRQPVPDAMLEIWQADAHGRYATPDFVGFARSATDDNGRFWFDTIKPGRVPDQAPHIVLTVFARGLLNHAVTRIYFADEPLNDADPILALLPSDRRTTLLARRTEHGYWFDVVLQGERETVFFNV